jgi:ureidoglycolate lyase
LEPPFFAKCELAFQRCKAVAIRSLFLIYPSPRVENSAVKIELLSRTAFTPFGEVISFEGATHYPINNGTTERYHDLARVDVSEGGGRPLISLFRAQPRSFPFEVLSMERHPFGSQAFYPLSSNPYLVIVAPIGKLEVSRLRVFYAFPTQGVNYAKGVWHHALIALHSISDFLIVDRGGDGPNCDEVDLASSVVLTPEEVTAAGRLK